MPFLAAAAIVLASPVLFPLAIVVYRIVRPGETLAESRERELADRVTELEAEAGCCQPRVAPRPSTPGWLACKVPQPVGAHLPLLAGR